MRGSVEGILSPGSTTAASSTASSLRKTTTSRIESRKWWQGKCRQRIKNDFETLIVGIRFLMDFWKVWTERVLRRHFPILEVGVRLRRYGGWYLGWVAYPQKMRRKRRVPWTREKLPRGGHSREMLVGTI